MRKKSGICLLAAVAILLSVTGCSLKDEHYKLIVQGTLDQDYHGVYDEDFLKLMARSQEEAEELHRENLEQMVNVFAYYFNIEYMNDTLRSEIIDLYTQMYAGASYTVGDVTEVDEDTYNVTVTVLPIGLLDQVLADMDGITESYSDKYVGVDTSEMTDAEYEDFYEAADADWAESILALCRDKLNGMSYLDGVTFVAEVVRGEDGEWAFTNTDAFDEIVVHYQQ